jgi:hypothetical protein
VDGGGGHWTGVFGGVPKYEAGRLLWGDCELVIRGFRRSNRFFFFFCLFMLRVSARLFSRSLPSAPCDTCEAAHVA